MKEELRRLLELYEIDKQIDKFARRKKDIPKLIESVKKEIVETQESAKKFVDELRKTEVLLGKKDVELKAAEEELRKHQSQLLQLKTNEEYRAMLAQIERDKQKISELEDEIIELLERLDEMKAKRKEVEEAAKRKSQELRKKIEELKKEYDGIDDKLELLRAERERREFLAKKENPRLLSKYNRLRTNGIKDPIVPIVDDACGGCHAKLPIQVINEIRLSGTVSTCEQCGRLIYWKESASHSN